MTAHKPGDPTTLNRLYGRSMGHKLRPAQQELVDTLLPQIAVPAEGDVTARRLFNDDRPLHLEIGFGSGEHLAFRADLLPGHGFIGAEPFVNGVATFLKTKANGWPELEVGGPGFCFPVLRWTGQAFATHRHAYDGKRCTP